MVHNLVRPFAVLMISAAVYGQELPPRDIAARARPAVVVVSALRDGQVVSQGSGFFVSSDGRLITNRHVIEGGDSLRVQLSTGEIYDNVYFVSDDERRDLAILRIPESGLQPLSIGDERTAAVGDQVYVIGNPLGLEGTFSDGLISALRTVDGVALIQISAPISSGSSGGPVFNTRGEVIGIATLTMENGQNLNLAVPARYARGLLQMNETPQPFERVAARFNVTQRSSTPVSAVEASETEPWLRVLHDEMRALRDAAFQNGYRSIHEPKMGMLHQGKNEVFQLEFQRGSNVAIIGACDLDCGDLDIGVYTLDGEEIGTDVLDDDSPEVDFVVSRSGNFQVVVSMAKCTREPCGFGVQSFTKAR